MIDHILSDLGLTLAMHDTTNTFCYTWAIAVPDLSCGQGPGWSFRFPRGATLIFCKEVEAARLLQSLRLLDWGRYNPPQSVA